MSAQRLLCSEKTLQFVVDASVLLWNRGVATIRSILEGAGIRWFGMMSTAVAYRLESRA